MTRFINNLNYTIMPHYTEFLENALKSGERLTDLEKYRLLKPEEYINYVFNIRSITVYLRHIFTSLYPGYLNYHPDKIRDLLLKNFHHSDRKIFFGNLKEYIFRTVDTQKSLLGKARKEEHDFHNIEKNYIPELIDYFVLFLRDQLLRQEDFDISEEFDSKNKNLDIGYYFLDLTCHEFSIGKTIGFTGYLKYIDEEPDEIYGVQKGYLKFEDVSDIDFEFDIETKSFRRYRKKLEKEIFDRIYFKIKILEILESKYCYAKIISLD